MCLLYSIKSKLKLTDINNYNTKELHSTLDYKPYSKKSVKRFLELVDDIVSKNMDSYLYRKFIEDYESKLIKNLNMYIINPQNNLQNIINNNGEYFELLDIITYAISQLSLNEVNIISKHSNTNKDIKTLLNKLIDSSNKFVGKYTNFTNKGEVNTQSYSKELIEVLDLFRIGQSPTFDWKGRGRLRQALIQLKIGNEDNEDNINLNLEEIPILLNRLYTSNYEIIEQKKGVLEDVKYLISRRNTRNLIHEYLSRTHRKQIVNDLYSEFYLPSVNEVSKMNQYLKFKEDNDKTNILPYIINFVLFGNKQQYNLDQSAQYDFEILYYLYAFNKYYGYVTDEKTILFIDEYQNLSASEIIIAKMVMNNLELNLYGDKNQITTNKEFLDLSNEQDYWETFNIYKNYRNARNIVEYMNKTLSHSIESIDISGNVNEITKLSQVNMTIDRVDLNNINDRIAIIVKDYAFIDQKDLISLNIPFTYINSEDVEIKRNTFNIIKPDLIKGLEFEIVIVYDKGLTFNERYIAYSRALKQLHVIKVDIS